MIEAIITGVVALIVCLINNDYQNKRMKTENDKTVALIDYRLSELTKQVEKHNSLVERTYRLEESGKIHEEKIKVINHRIADLEGK